MKQDLQEKIKQCKALQNMTVEDVIKTDRFHDNLAAYWTAQKEDREAIRKSYEAMRKAGGAKGMKIPAHPVDHLRNLTTDDLSFLLHSDIRQALFVARRPTSVYSTDMRTGIRIDRGAICR